VLLAAALLFFFFRGVQWDAIAQAFRTAHPGYLLGAAGSTVLTYLIRAWRWGRLLRPLARVPFLDLFSATVVGFTSGMVIPRAGEVLRPYLIARRFPVSTSAGFASIILERLIDVVTVLLLFFAYLYVLPTPAAQITGGVMGYVKIGGALAGLLALAVLGMLLALHRNAEPVISLVARLLGWVPTRFREPVLGGLRSFAGGLAVLHAAPGFLFLILGESLLLWLSIALGIYWTNCAFGLGHLPFHSAFLVITFLVVGVAVPTPGSVGGFHEFYLLALTQAYGVDKGVAAAAGIACHALSNLPVLFLGLAFLGREGLSFGKVAEMSEQTPPVDDAPPGPLVEGAGR
jgi:glycosyltransferase 2 family protein